MLDIKFVRDNPELVKENIKKKFQEEKLPLVDQVIELDRRNRDAMTEANNLRSERNKLSKQVGMLMGQAKKARLRQRGGGAVRRAGGARLRDSLPHRHYGAL